MWEPQIQQTVVTYAAKFPGTACIWFCTSGETWNWRSTDRINTLDALQIDIWTVILEIMKRDIYHVSLSLLPSVKWVSVLEDTILGKYCSKS
jgi:hypothetical protein